MMCPATVTAFINFYWYVSVCFCVPGKLNVKEEELDEMLNEGKGPINFTVFLTLFGEKLSGETFTDVQRNL